MAEQTEPIEFERGDKVRHPKWGMGTILYKSGVGERSKVIVLFQEVGQKTLMVQFAKLEKVASSQSKSKSKAAYESLEEEPVEEIPSDDTATDDGLHEEESEEEEEEEDL